ncbi:hypothetical protein ACWCQB_38120 [Streptomyces hirsutus]
MPNDRNTIATALLGTAFVGFVALAYPGVIPALALALAAFMGFAAFLKL